MTGYSTEIIDKEGLLEPGLTVLFKPLTPSAILEKVREVLDAGGQREGRSGRPASTLAGTAPRKEPRGAGEDDSR